MPIESMAYLAAGRALNEYLQERRERRATAQMLQEQNRAASLTSQSVRRPSRSHVLRRSKVRLLRLFG